MDTDAISEEEWTEWKRKRRHTLIGYLFVGGMVGIDYSFMFTTLYLYLEQMIKTPNPRFDSKVKLFFNNKWFFYSALIYDAGIENRPDQ